MDPSHSSGSLHPVDSSVQGAAADADEDFDKQRISLEDLRKLKEVFDEAAEAGGDGQLTEDQFLSAFAPILGRTMSEEQLRLWFMRVDASANGAVDWDEFSSFLLYSTDKEQRIVTSSGVSIDEVSFVKDPRTAIGAGLVASATKVSGYNHADSMTKVLVHPRGTIYTCGQDGTIRMWNGDSLEFIGMLHNGKGWVMDMAFAKEYTKIVAITLDRLVLVFDVHGDRLFRGFAGTVDLASITQEVAQKQAAEAASRHASQARESHQPVGGSGAPRGRSLPGGQGKGAAAAAGSSPRQRRAPAPPSDASPPQTSLNAGGLAAQRAPSVRVGGYRVQAPTTIEIAWPKPLSRQDIDRRRIKPHNSSASKDGIESVEEYRQRLEQQRHTVTPTVKVTVLSGMEVPALSMAILPASATESGTEQVVLGLTDGSVMAFAIFAPHVNNQALQPTMTFAQLHEGAFVTCVKWVPGIASIITCGSDGKIFVINPMKKTCHRACERYAVDHPIHDCVWISTERLLATCGNDRHVNLWSLTSKGPPIPIKGHLSHVAKLLYREEDNLLFTLDIDKCIKVWDVRTLRPIQSLVDYDTYKPIDRMTSLTYDARRHCLVTGVVAPVLWSMGRLLVPYPDPKYCGHQKAVLGVLYSEVFHQIVTCDTDQIKNWAVEDGSLVSTLTIESLRATAVRSSVPSENYGAIYNIAFDGPGRRLLIAVTSGSVLIANFANGQLLQELVPQLPHRDRRDYSASECSALAYFTSGAKAYVGCVRGSELLVWEDVAEGTLEKPLDRIVSLHLPKRTFLHFAVQPPSAGLVNGTARYRPPIPLSITGMPPTYLAVGTDCGLVVVYNTITLDVLSVFGTYDTNLNVTALHYHARRELLFAAKSDGTVDVLSQSQASREVKFSINLRDPQTPKHATATTINSLASGLVAIGTDEGYVFLFDFSEFSLDLPLRQMHVATLYHAEHACRLIGGWQAHKDDIMRIEMYYPDAHNSSSAANSPSASMRHVKQRPITTKVVIITTGSDCQTRLWETTPGQSPGLQVKTVNSLHFDSDPNLGHQIGDPALDSKDTVPGDDVACDDDGGDVNTARQNRNRAARLAAAAAAASELATDDDGSDGDGTTGASSSPKDAPHHRRQRSGGVSTTSGNTPTPPPPASLAAASGTPGGLHINLPAWSPSQGETAVHPQHAAPLPFNDVRLIGYCGAHEGWDPAEALPRLKALPFIPAPLINATIDYFKVARNVVAALARNEVLYKKATIVESHVERTLLTNDEPVSPQTKAREALEEKRRTKLDRVIAAPRIAMPAKDTSAALLLGTDFTPSGDSVDYARANPPPFMPAMASRAQNVSAAAGGGGGGEADGAMSVDPRLGSLSGRATGHRSAALASRATQPPAASRNAHSRLNAAAEGGLVSKDVVARRRRRSFVGNLSVDPDASAFADASITSPRHEHGGLPSPMAATMAAASSPRNKSEDAAVATPASPPARQGNQTPALKLPAINVSASSPRVRAEPAELVKPPAALDASPAPTAPASSTVGTLPRIDLGRASELQQQAAREMHNPDLLFAAPPTTSALSTGTGGSDAPMRSPSRDHLMALSRMASEQQLGDDEADMEALADEERLLARERRLPLSARIDQWKRTQQTKPARTAVQAWTARPHGKISLASLDADVVSSATSTRRRQIALLEFDTRMMAKRRGLNM